MKRLLLISCEVAASFSAGFAQKIKASNVPQVVKNAFMKTYPGQSAKREKEKGNYEAAFKKDGKTMSATFEPNGNFMESETDIIPTIMIPGKI
jgi:hypothetical protein